MAEVTRTDVETAISNYVDPYLEQDLTSAKAVKDITIDADQIVVKIVLGFPAQGHLPQGWRPPWRPSTTGQRG